MKKIALLITCLTLAVTANASETFSGFGVGLNTGFTQIKTKLKDYDIDDGYFNKNIKKGSFTAGINLNYAFPIANRFVLTPGVTYDFTKQKMGKDYGSDVKYQNHFSIYLAPGFKVTEEVLIYGKLAYHSIKAKDKDKDKDLINRYNKTFSGVGFGMGAAYSIMPNLELNGELQYVKYGEKEFFRSDNGEYTKASPTSLLYTIGVTYRF